MSDQDAQPQAELDALLAALEAERPAFAAWLAEYSANAQRELDAMLEAMRPEQEAYLALLEAERPQREAELAALFEELRPVTEAGLAAMAAYAERELAAPRDGASEGLADSRDTDDDTGATRKR